MNKKTIVIASLSILSIVLLIFVGIKINKKIELKNAKIVVELKEDLETEFLSKVKVSDFITNINGLITNDYNIDTTIIGEKEIKFEYINEDNIKIPYSYELNIKDTTPPVVWLGSSYTVNKGSKVNLTEKIMCGDNYDDNPSCEII